MPRGSCPLSFCHFGLVVCVLCVLMAGTPALEASSFRGFITFNGDNGSTPVYPRLVQAKDGNLYGTTLGGGAFGAGTIFRVSPSGLLTTLYSFCSAANCDDGSLPYAGLILGSDGNFYGTTSQGGSFGWGTIFKFTPGGVLVTLHSFSLVDGAGPEASLVQANDGSFYGTTNFGGLTNGGTVFNISRTGAFKSLYTFDGTVGESPIAALVEGRDGALYGVTQAGNGNIFRITKSGAATNLYNFSITDGRFPNELILASDGNFYGTTYAGGTSPACSSNGCGTVFKISVDGALTTLYNFDVTHGSQPIAALTQASDGNYYGSTYSGGSHNAGTLFEITSQGIFTSLHTFDTIDGQQPYGPLSQDTNGIIYGTTPYGGTAQQGTIFALSLGLHPFVIPQPALGKVGSLVRVLGTGLTDTLSVSFNGQTATFTVISDSEVDATVPVGATSGPVQLRTANQTLQSNVWFRVRP